MTNKEILDIAMQQSAYDINAGVIAATIGYLMKNRRFRLVALQKRKLNYAGAGNKKGIE